MKLPAMSKIKFGFTLVELLVVISIIGILSTVLLANFNAARERSRDTQRKADLRNLQTALRLYYSDYGSFPTSSSANEIKGCGQGGIYSCPWGSTSGFVADSKVYMQVMPKDPLPSQSYQYVYVDPDTYTLSACLENKSDDKGQSAGGTSWCATNWMYQVKP